MIQETSASDTRPIVVGVGDTDGERTSDPVVRWGALVARSCARPLLLLHAWSPVAGLPATAMLTGYVCATPAHVETERADACRTLHNQAKRTAREFPDLEISVLLATGDARVVVAGFDALADQLVFGAPPGPARRTYLGLSWTRRLALSVGVPVSLVPRGWRPGSVAAVMSGEPSDQSVLRYAMTLGERTGQPVCVIELEDVDRIRPDWNLCARLFDLIDSARDSYPTVELHIDITTTEQLPFSLASTAAAIVTSNGRGRHRHPTPTQRAIRTLSWSHQAPLITLPD